MAAIKESQNVTLTLPADMVAYLDREAFKLDLSRSQVVRLIVREYQAKKKG
jgi:metal-responsive CopG/Arc/MetJ family transcriptional regulator